ncbi:MAG: DUF1501 domain-containing protein [Gammaproteobacteria bacterium]
MKRRDFLARMALSACATTLPGGAALARTARPPRGRILILVELQGGNDGLNTVVPFSDPLYRRLRGDLAIGRDDVVQLDEGLGLHPALAGLKSTWDQGELGIALGVGYPDPVLSHFRSIDIWNTASDSKETSETGWIASLLSGQRPAGNFGADALCLDGRLGPLQGEGISALVLKRPERFLRDARRYGAPGAESHNAALAHILSVRARNGAAATDFSHVFEEASSRGDAPAPGFPAGAFGRQLQTAARLVRAPVSAPVIKLSLGSFDTHARQSAPHERLLRQLGDGLAALRRTLVSSGDWNRVLVMTYSEFGRRPKVNGSGGTDHGTASVHLALGGRVSGGFHGR